MKFAHQQQHDTSPDSPSTVQVRASTQHEEHEVLGAVSDSGKGRLLQAKLNVSSPNDPLEIEAERVANEYVNWGLTLSQPLSSDDQREARLAASRRGSAPEPSTQPDTEVESGISRMIGSGKQLPSASVNSFSEFFGAKLDSVRIHDNAQSDGLCRSLAAEAFATGKDVFFSSGSYRPGTLSGDHLLAHELTHVVQQNPGLSRRPLVNPAPGGRSPLISKAGEGATPEPEATPEPGAYTGPKYSKENPAYETNKAEFVENFKKKFLEANYEGESLVDGKEAEFETEAGEIFDGLCEMLGLTDKVMGSRSLKGRAPGQVLMGTTEWEETAHGWDQTGRTIPAKAYTEALRIAEPFGEKCLQFAQKLAAAKKESTVGFAFWSGKGAKEAAAASGLRSLEGGVLGGMFDGSYFGLAESSEEEGKFMVLWGTISNKFAQWAADITVNRTYHGYVGPGAESPQSIYRVVEYHSFAAFTEGKDPQPKVTWVPVVPSRDAYASVFDPSKTGDQAFPLGAADAGLKFVKSDFRTGGSLILGSGQGRNTRDEAVADMQKAHEERSAEVRAAINARVGQTQGGTGSL